MLIYTEEKKFTKEQIQKLFLSVHWISGNYPNWLYKALMNSSTVLTVWDDEKLVGLTRVLDDTEMLAQIHYVLERTGINQADISKLEFVTKQKVWLYDLTGLLSGEVIILRRKTMIKVLFICHGSIFRKLWKPWIYRMFWTLREQFTKNLLRTDN